METYISVMKLILIMATLVLLSDAQDVVCKSGRTKKKISIGAGDSFSFKTQAGASYAPNTKCFATYKKKKACPMITFSCSEFNINNKDASCKRKDKMIVQEKGKARTSYCQTTGPAITTSAATLKVSFLSDKKRHASGAVCTVQCNDGTTTATTPSTTTTASTTTDTAPPTTTGGGRPPPPDLCGACRPGCEEVTLPGPWEKTCSCPSASCPTCCLDTCQAGLWQCHKYGACLTGTCPAVSKECLLYSWSTGWDNTVDGCTEEAYMVFDDAPENEICFTHTWNTPYKRNKLFDACNILGREVGTLLLSDIRWTVENAHTSGDCSSDEVFYLRETLALGHMYSVANIKIYGLLSIGGASVNERFVVPHMVWYNENCAEADSEKFDGVAVNNEAFDKSWTLEEHIDYLTNLKEIALNAEGKLKTHYSIGWHWYKDNGGTRIDLDFEGTTKNVLQHIIDIFDSTDVQVSTVKESNMICRLQKSFDTSECATAPNIWDYSQLVGKTMYALLYTNKGTDSDSCSTHFFPRTDCSGATDWSLYHSEAAMWAEIDTATTALPGFIPALHYYRGGYSSGGHEDWPQH